MAKTITVDATSTKAWNTTKTWNHTVGTGGNRLLIVGVGVRNNSVTGITYDSVAMSLIKEGDTYGECIYALVNPNVGTHQIAVTTNGSDSLAGGALSVFNADQTSPADGTDYDSGNPASSSITPTLANGVAFHCFVSEDDTDGSFGAGQTAITESFGTDGGGQSYKTYSDTSAVTMSYDPAASCYQVMACFKPALDKPKVIFID